MVVLRKFLWIALPLIVAAFLLTDSHANNRRPDSPPSQPEDFEIHHIDESSVTLRFTNSGDNPLLKISRNFFVGIPIEATFTIEPLTWDIGYYENRVETKRLISGQPNDVTFSVEEAITSGFSPEIHQFHQLDVLKLQFSPLVDAPDGSTVSNYQRDKLSIQSLEFKVAWQANPVQTNQNKTAKVPEIDAGYKRLYQDLLVNAEFVDSFRTRRTLPEDEVNMGFSPAALAYQFDATITNRADGPLPYHDHVIRVRVRDKGMTAIRPADIAEQGKDPSTVQLEHVRLWHQGEEQAIFVEDDGNGKFDGDDAIYFYSPKPDSDFTKDAIFFMSWHNMDTEPARIVASALPNTERQHDYYPVRKRVDSEHKLVQIKSNDYGWYHQSLTEKNTGFSFDLDAPVPQGSVTLSMDLLNKSRQNDVMMVQVGDRRERAEIKINEATQVQINYADQSLEETLELSLILAEEPEQQTAASMSARVGNEPYIHIKSIAITYPRAATYTNEVVLIEHSVLPDDFTSVPLHLEQDAEAFDVWVIHQNQLVGRWQWDSEQDYEAFPLPEQPWDELMIVPQKGAPGPYTVDQDPVTTLHHADQGFNYIIIAHQIFLDEAERLAQIRREDGFKVLLVDVQDIYDEFNFGYPENIAIRRFLRYAQAEWTDYNPEFVCLIGDSSWDHRDREGTGAVDQVPTYAPKNNPQIDGTDEWYAYLWETDSDKFSDVIIGRISVREPEELANYIDKLSTYRDEMPVGPWKMRNIFITDDTFERYSNTSARESLPAEMVPEHIDQIDFPHVTNPYLFHRFQDDPDPSAQEYTNKKYCPECTQAIIEGFDEGALLVQYIGHGGNQIWSHERIFYGTDRPYSNVLELAPNNKFPFLLNWSCLTGYLNYNVPPFTVCLAEEFIRYKDKGAIAMWAPSGSASTDQHMLMTHLMKRKLIKQRLSRVGEAITSTKLEYLQIQYHPQLMEQYILFGDPAVNIALPTEDLNLVVSPEIMYQNKEMTFDISSKIELFAEGQAVVALAVDGNTVYQSEPFGFENNQIDHTLSVAFETIDYATGKISLYAWNEDANVDAWGGTVVTKYEPQLQITGAQAQRDNDETVIYYAVYNDSAFDAKDILFNLDLANTVETLTLANIPANATTYGEWRGTVPLELETAHIQLDDPSFTGSRSRETGLVIELPVDQPNLVYPLLGKRRISNDDAIEGTNTRMQIPFTSRPGVENASAIVSLEGLGVEVEEKEVTVPDSRERSVDFMISLPESGEHQYTLHVTAEGNTHSYNFPLYVWGKPDLALAEGDFEIEPEKPVIGKTVRIKTHLYNVGNGPASNITINAYDGAPSLNRVLRPFNRRHVRDIGRLEPGDMIPVEFVWDPDSYDGLGLHEIHIVVDPHRRIEEISENNNRIRFPLTFHDLPDLMVDPWTDHSMSTAIKYGRAIWGQPLTIQALVRNIGESTAEHVRLSVFHNNNEYSKFMRDIRPRSGNETRFDVPLISPKNTLQIYADKYDLIAEINEKAESPANNQSLKKMMYVDLVMPIAPVVNRFRTYQIQNETQYASGLGEFIVYEERHNHLILHPDMNEQYVHLQPVYVQNQEDYSARRADNKWFWFTTYNLFAEPKTPGIPLRAEMPSPRGNYDVYVKLFSSAHDTKNASSTIEYKTAADEDYVTIVHPNEAYDEWYKLGRYEIQDDLFLVEFRSNDDAIHSNISGLKYVRVEDSDIPAANGYQSAFFPADGATGRMAELTWEAEIPENTDMIVKARWASIKEDGTLRYTPWAGSVNGAEQKLMLAGKGDFFQFYVDFIRHSFDHTTPELSNIQVKIPCQE